MKNELRAWKWFEKTGRVDAYLFYRRCVERAYNDVPIPPVQQRTKDGAQNAENKYHTAVSTKTPDRGPVHP